MASLSKGLRVVGVLVFVVAAGMTQRQLTARAASIDESALLHNSWDTTYRAPYGAVKAGTSVTISFRTAHAGATGVTLVADFQKIADFGTATTTPVVQQPMTLASQGGQYDTWQTTFVPASVGIYLYRFMVTNGDAIDWYGTGGSSQYGGTGKAWGSQIPAAASFHVTSYAPSFTAPSWAKNSVLYEIFPDRFFNGDTSNDKKGESKIYGGMLTNSQNDFCSPRAVLHTSQSQDPLNNCDFFGGDLQGIIAKLPYLKKLGVNMIYLTPIFQAPSNHKYDTSSYMKIDPRFGTLRTFKTLIKDIHKDKMHIILDGVFNHTSSDSIYFNKFKTFKGTGAFQSQTSKYYPWYTFTQWPDKYESFSGINTLPQLTEADAVKNFIFRGKNSVAQYWLGMGVDGWRLDYATGKSHLWWQEFRQSVKGRFPKDIMIGELDFNGSSLPWFMGNELDGNMNYRWMQIAYQLTENTRFPVSRVFNLMKYIDEEYPQPAKDSIMTLLDSHDQDRVTSRTSGDTALQKLLVTLQMTWTGIPMIYYGDEAGLQGAGSDPSKRRFFPWSSQDTSLEAFYRTVIAVRKANPALKDGSVNPLFFDDSNRVMAYTRQDSRQTVAVLLHAPGATGIAQESLSFPTLADGTILTDALTGQAYTVTNHTVIVSIPEKGEMVLVQKPG